MSTQIAEYNASYCERIRLARLAREALTVKPAHNIAEPEKQRAAPKAGATATKPAATTAPTRAPFVPDYAAICTAFREDAAKHATKPVSLGAAQNETQSKDPAFLQRLEDQETVATVLRIRINAGLASPPLTDEVTRIIKNAEAAGVPFDPATRDA